MKKQQKRMKLPNGFGSIVKLSGRRRKPWAVRKKINGHYKYLGYFVTYEEALIFLSNYNQDPSAYSAQLITFAEIFELELAERIKYKRIKEPTVKNYRTCFGYCAKLHNRKFTSLRVTDLQSIISELSEQGIGQPSQKKTRQLYHNLYNYAVKYQIIDKKDDISNYVDIDKYEPQEPKTPFNSRQLNRVKALAESNDPLAKWATTVMMMCYSGPRPSEFLSIRKEDVKLHNRFFKIRDSKTDAGKNRLVPINRKVLPYFAAWMQMPGGNLITDINGKRVDYGSFYRIFRKVMTASRCRHTPHECRHTTATWLDNKGANRTAVKRILGHADKDITSGVYTHKDLRQLKKAIDLL